MMVTGNHVQRFFGYAKMTSDKRYGAPVGGILCSLLLHLYFESPGSNLHYTLFACPRFHLHPNEHIFLLCAVNCKLFTVSYTSLLILPLPTHALPSRQEHHLWKYLREARAYCRARKDGRSNGARKVHIALAGTDPCIGFSLPHSLRELQLCCLLLSQLFRAKCQRASNDQIHRPVSTAQERLDHP